LHRRSLLALLGTSAAAWPLAAGAQQAKRLGILRGGVEFERNATQVLLDGLAQLGWIEGKNLRVDYRQAGANDANTIRPHAEALVRAAPDAIFVSAGTAVQVLQRVTQTIPVVFLQSGDPVQDGTVKSLARPGGNLTGFVVFESTINTKYLQLLKDIAPQVKGVAVVQSQATTRRGDFAVIDAVAQSFGVTVQSKLVRNDAMDIERAIEAFAREPNGGLILPPDNTTTRNRELIVALAAKHQLPAVYSDRVWVDAGGMLSYAAAPTDYRQVASYIDRILRGARPADLPVQTPAKFELVIKLKAATDLGLKIPPSLFALADEVIE
jgi:putative ABC transport system substrate-binding protein